MKKPWSKDEDSIVGARTTPAQARGRIAEDAAADHLLHHGLGILARNIRCRGGELDLIATDHETVIFVEVRLRRSQRFGGAAESITANKQRRVVHAARWWLAGHGRKYANHPCRFDVILFDNPEADRPDWIRGAFAAD